MKYRMEDRNEDYFIDIATCGKFTIKWSIMDSNLIDPVMGELHVVVE